ncbi:Type I inositol trisphosphate 5-phosphatase 2 [Pyrenophora seminiperda CCB06]|uniref:Type I inositol trisphosphate 5-phosphatase 2 n=1 Tax=Pyrenophora seminiperda CCB06 TaxID=1302712 RepID=A0A3M7MDL5_9PLEO|nr:Type I inositol trisphosphate 5-phosphatase 2 [Pyrenophora seminiperda CCB06]
MSRPLWLYCHDPGAYAYAQCAAAAEHLKFDVSFESAKWNIVVDRRHITKGLFANSTKTDGLPCITNMAMELHNGKSIQGAFACRFQVRDAQGEAPSLSVCRIGQ